MAPKQKNKGGKKGQSKHRVNLVPTFKKKKVKVGRSLPKGVNDTKINVQTRSIVIVQQFTGEDKVSESEKCVLTWSAIQPVVAHLTHHNVNARRNALATLRNKLKAAENGANCSFFNEILRAVCPILSDSDEQCRKVTNEILKLLIEAHSENELRPFEALIVANLNVALTSADNTVRRDALFVTFDMLVAAASRTVQRYASTLLRNVIDQLTKRVVQSTTKHSNQTRSNSAKSSSNAETNASVTKSHAILTSTEGAITSLRNRARLLERLLTLFSIAIGSKSNRHFQNNTETQAETETGTAIEVESVTNPAAIRDLCVRSASQFGAIALQIVVEANETLADFEDKSTRRDALGSRRDISTATDCLLHVVRILNSLFEAFNTDQRSNWTCESSSSDLARLQEAFQPVRKELVRHLMRRFPYAYLSLDDEVCRLVLCFYAAARSKSQRAAFSDALSDISQHVKTRIDEVLRSSSANSADIETSLDEIAALTKLADWFSTVHEPAARSLRTDLLKLLELAARRIIGRQSSFSSLRNCELISQFTQVVDVLLRSSERSTSLACYSAIELLPRIFIALQLDIEQHQDFATAISVANTVSVAIRRCLVDRILRCAALGAIVQQLTDALKNVTNDSAISLRFDANSIVLTDAAFIALVNAFLPFVYYVPTNCDLNEERNIYTLLSRLCSSLVERHVKQGGDASGKRSYSWLCCQLISIVASRFERCVSEQSADAVQAQLLPNRLAALLSLFLTTLRDAIGEMRPYESCQAKVRLDFVVKFSATVRNALVTMNDTLKLTPGTLCYTIFNQLTDALKFDPVRLTQSLTADCFDSNSSLIVWVATVTSALLSVSLSASASASITVASDIKADNLSNAAPLGITRVRELAINLHQELHKHASDEFCGTARQFISDWLS